MVMQKFPSGCHVVQKIIKTFPNIDFIFDVIRDELLDVACNKYGEELLIYPQLFKISKLTQESAYSILIHALPLWNDTTI
jgi:hypothetical protein